MSASHIHDLALILDDLEAHGRLTRVRSEVDPVHDLAGIAAELEGGPRAVLFEKVRGHRWPVVTGLYWNRHMLAALLRREEKTLPQYVSGCIKNWQTNPVHPVVVDDGPVTEVTENEVNLASIPVPVHATRDGGAYFDAGVVIAKDPETGVRNASIQRFQVIDGETLHVNIDAGRHLELYLEKARNRGQTLTFTLNCGVGPGLHFAGSAPAEAAPPDADELGIASEFHGAPLELVRATNGHDDMVAHAMWALECEIIPGEVANEGPFAEVTGYYATVAPRPVVHVRKIHRRSNPVFQTILSGMEVWNSVGLLGEANVLSLLQRQVPGVLDVYFSHGGCGFYHCLVQMTQARAGWGKQAIMAAFAAFPPLKMVTVVDEDVDIRSAQDVEWAMATRLNPKHGIVTIDHAFGHGLNPSFPDYLGPKVGFDCTRPYPHTYEYERATFKEMALTGLDIHEPDIVEPVVAAAAGARPVSAPVQQWQTPARKLERVFARLKRRQEAERLQALAAPVLADLQALARGGQGRTAPPKPAAATDPDDSRDTARPAEAPTPDMPRAGTGAQWRDAAARSARAMTRLRRQHEQARLDAIGAPALADVAGLRRGGLGRAPVEPASTPAGAIDLQPAAAAAPPSDATRPPAAAAAQEIPAPGSPVVIRPQPPRRPAPGPGPSLKTRPAQGGAKPANAGNGAAPVTPFRRLGAASAAPASPAYRSPLDIARRRMAGFRPAPQPPGPPRDKPGGDA